MKSLLRKIGLTLIAVLTATTGGAISATCQPGFESNCSCCCSPAAASLAENPTTNSCSDCEICAEPVSAASEPEVALPAPVVLGVLPDTFQLIQVARLAESKVATLGIEENWHSFDHEPWFGRAPPCSF